MILHVLKHKLALNLCMLTCLLCLCTVLHDYCAHCSAALLLLYRKKVSLSSALTPIVVNASLGLYQVTSSKDASVVYDVDIHRGYCTCYSGLTGACCKHQLAAADAGGVRLPNIPVAVSRDDRHQLAVLALGDNAPPPAFFDTLRGDSSLSVPSKCVPAIHNELVDVLLVSTLVS